jgi:hypothetical protein
LFPSVVFVEFGSNVLSNNEFKQTSNWPFVASSSSTILNVVPSILVNAKQSFDALMNLKPSSKYASFTVKG